jgi:tetratricopeptide (TPR) repeat protein
MVGIRGILLLGLLLLTACSSPEARFAEKMGQANENLEKGDVQKAIKLLEQLKSQFPDKSQILENLAFAFVQAKDYNTGAFYFNQLAQTFPENTDYYLYAAQAWVNAGDAKSAIKDYEAYLLVKPADWNTWQKIGDLYLETNQKSKAIHAYSNSSEIRFNPELELKSSLLANESGNLREAEAGFEKLLMVEDSEVAKQAHIGLIQIKHKRRQWEAVEKLIKTLEARFPKVLESPELVKVLADYKSFNKAKVAESEKIKEEEERRKRLIEQQRERAEQMAAARLAASKPKEEISQVPPSSLAVEEEQITTPNIERSTKPPAITKPVEKSPFELALEKARRINSTNSEQAVGAYWDAINKGDTTGEAFYELARVYYNRNQFSEAEMTSLEALRRGPTNNRYLLTYLNVIRKTKPKPDVVGEIQKYRRLYPKNPDLVLILARIYAEPGGDPVSARTLYDMFFQMAPNHPDIERAKYEARGI